MDVNSIDYFETHGTGTPLGDPIEIEAILDAIESRKTGPIPPNTNVVFGSVKANIGHQEAGAGLAGLIAAILVLEKETVPPNAGLTKLNPRIRNLTQESPLNCIFPTEITSLREISSKTWNEPLVAGVSSFGYTGTIAHAVVRQPLHYKKKLLQNQKGQILFVFTGQGSQYPGMGKELYEENNHFRLVMDNCNEIYKNLKGEDHDLLDLMFALSEDNLASTDISQPALVALEWSLAMTLQDHGVCPTLVLGHSVGEITAACVAGAMSIEAGLELAIRRGELMSNLSSVDGVMVAVQCNVAEAKAAMTAAGITVRPTTSC